MAKSGGTTMEAILWVTGTSGEGLSPASTPAPIAKKLLTRGLRPSKLLGLVNRATIDHGLKMGCQGMDSALFSLLVHSGGN
jgi:hypothetical protein